jgi:hypothetical protein
MLATEQGVVADQKPVEDKAKLIVRPKPDRVSRDNNVEPIKTSKSTGPGKAYRAKIETLLAELAYERLVAIWQQVCPLPTAFELGLPDRLGIIQDLADFAAVLQPNLKDMTADQLCRQVEKNGGAANRKKNRPSLRRKASRVKTPASSSRRRSTSGSLLKLRILLPTAAIQRIRQSRARPVIATVPCSCFLTS